MWEKRAMNWRCDHWHNKLLWLEPWGKVAKDIQSMSRLDLKAIIQWTDCIMSMRSSFQWMELIWTPQQATDWLLFKALQEWLDVYTKTWEELALRYLPSKVNSNMFPVKNIPDTECRCYDSHNPWQWLSTMFVTHYSFIYTKQQWSSAFIYYFW